VSRFIKKVKSADHGRGNN